MTPAKKKPAALGDVLAGVLEKWVQHFLGVAVTIKPLQKVEDEAWRWHIGLDVDATALLNDLYEGREVASERMQRLACRLRLGADRPAHHGGSAEDLASGDWGLECGGAVGGSAP